MAVIASTGVDEAGHGGRLDRPDASGHRRSGVAILAHVAGGGIYRVQLGWTAVGRGTGHAGTLNIRAEYRGRIGPLGPSTLSGDLGIATVNSGFAYSDEFGPDLAVVNWTQMFAGGKAGLAVGRLDFAAYLDPYRR